MNMALSDTTPSTFVVEKDSDVVTVRQLARNMAMQLEFSRPDQALVSTAVSELARNIVRYAGAGEIELTPVASERRVGLRIVSRDNGPGIPDIEAAMSDGYSTGNSLGLGLPGTRRIVDEFNITSNEGEGVVVTAVKWRFV